MRTLHWPTSLETVICVLRTTVSAGMLYNANVNLTSLPSSDKAEGCSKLQVYFHTGCLISQTDSLSNSTPSAYNLLRVFIFFVNLYHVILEDGPAHEVQIKANEELISIFNLTVNIIKQIRSQRNCSMYHMSLTYTG
jgi:hypothetical protein